MRKPSLAAGLIVLCLSWGAQTASAQPVPQEQEAAIRSQLGKLEAAVAQLKTDKKPRSQIADVEVFAKAVEWALRHDEFYKRGEKPSVYGQYAIDALDIGLKRAAQLADGKTPWRTQSGRTIYGYYSKVDGSVQPYAIALPEGVNPRSADRWPLHVKLHGRGGTRNEIRFVNEHNGKPLTDGQDWIQIDVFGRTDNAYRYAGETDVFEAMADVGRRFRVDDKRITLWGFSMGGAGAWHLGLHYPSQWSSVGPGAGFVDFYKYQNVTTKLPPWQDKTLRIYDSIDYALNAFDVPICTYGGELDKQLVASTEVVEAAKKLDVPIKLLIGPGMGHKFHPQSFKEFMAFHREKSKAGRKSYPGLKHIRFITYTPKYNTCEWLIIEELAKMYEPAVVEGKIEESGLLKLTTKNCAALQIDRDVAEQIEIDGTRFPLIGAADGLLPGVYYQRTGEEWRVLDYNESRTFASNPDRRKRKNLQGPIDDAFMQPFVCVVGTGKAWNDAHQAWADWTLRRFEREFDKYLRGQVLIVKDKDVTQEMMEGKNLILFGDPGSNTLIARVLGKLPVSWTKDAFEVRGKKYDPSTHGLAMIYPNPLSPNRYVVLNSGHTFHEKDFKASNSWLFPRLGDVGVLKFERKGEEHAEEILWGDLFDGNWRLGE